MELIKLNFEKIFFILLGSTFFIGIWHALPMLIVINDEMFYVGGVLRAMDVHTIMPIGTYVPYGTLTYLSYYIMTIFTLPAMLPFFDFSISTLKEFIIQSPEIMYVFLRILSSLFALVSLFFVNKILKKEIKDIKTRFFLIVLLFTNMITMVIMHTGKMWVLSVLLVLVSFYYLYKAVADEDKDKDRKVLKKNAFLSIVFSFLAFSNFPLNIFSLINIPLLVYFFRKDRELLWEMAKYITIGFSVFVLFTLFNFAGIKSQILDIFGSSGYHPVDSNFLMELNFFKSFSSYSLKLLCLFPLLIFTLLISFKNKIKNPKLLIISCTYFLAYFFTIIIVANWTTEFQYSLRYLFPLGFFLLFIITSFDIKFKKIFYVIGSISIVYFILTLYYLSIPTTYNEAYNWVNNNLGSENVVIFNKIRELQLVKNKKSYLLVQDKWSTIKTKNVIALDLNKEYKPLVLDKDTDFNLVEETKIKGIVYYIEEQPTVIDGAVLVQSFTNPSDIHHSVDYNMGNYFDFDFFFLKNLGKDIYIYKILRK
jgi:hypothetical protein